jgi:hypothetical protein
MAEWDVFWAKKDRPRITQNLVWICFFTCFAKKFLSDHPGYGEFLEFEYTDGRAEFTALENWIFYV